MTDDEAVTPAPASVDADTMHRAVDLWRSMAERWPEVITLERTEQLPAGWDALGWPVTGVDVLAVRVDLCDAVRELPGLGPVAVAEETGEVLVTMTLDGGPDEVLVVVDDEQTGFRHLGSWPEFLLGLGQVVEPVVRQLQPEFEAWRNGAGRDADADRVHSAVTDIFFDDLWDAVQEWYESHPAEPPRSRAPHEVRPPEPAVGRTFPAPGHGSGVLGSPDT